MSRLYIVILLPAYLTSIRVCHVKCQTGWLTRLIKIAGRNINNFSYSDDTTLMAENEKELKSLLMKVKEKSEKSSLQLNIQKTNIMASGPGANRWGKSVNSERFYFLGLQNHCKWWLQPWN